MVKTPQDNESLRNDRDQAAENGHTIRRFRLPLLLTAGLPLSLFAYWLVIRIEQTDVVGLPTSLAIYYHVVSLLAFLCVANALLRKGLPKVALSRAELLCLYSMMSVASAFACFESIGTLMPALVYPAAQVAWHSPDAGLATKILSRLPSWAVVHTPATAGLYLEGGKWSEFWPGWLRPLVAWGLLLACLQAMFMALSRLLWDQWAEYEKLSFPLTKLPLEMTDPQGKMWRSRLFWGGFAVAAVIDIVNGLHQFYPSLPFFDVKVHFLNAGTTPGAQAVGNTAWTMHPLMLGLGFLLPTDLSFSTWFFFLMGKAQKYLSGDWGIAHGSGWTFGGNVPGLIEQNIGAFFVLAGGWLWSARRHLKRRWNLARNGDRSAILDWLILIFGSVIWACGLTLLGLALPVAFAVVGLMLLMALFVTRIRAELGLPVYNLHSEGADTVLPGILGGAPLGERGMEAIASLHAITRSQQGHVMPHQMEGAFMCERAGGNTSRYWIAVCAAGAAAAIIGPWIMLKVISLHGVALFGSGFNPVHVEGWTQLEAKLGAPPHADITAIREMIGGGLFTAGLIALRYLWLASPFHPLGYAICGGWGTEMIVTPVAIAWAVKVLILKYGGLRTYEKAVPFALGLVMGEFIVGSLWTLLALTLHQETYRIWLF